MLTVERLSAIMTIGGSALFIGAALLPVSRVFVQPSPARKLEIINALPNVWTAAQILFAMGAVLTAAGLALAAFQFRAEAATWLVYASAAAVLVGALLWTWHVYGRAVDPAAFTQGALPAWPWFAYFVLTPIGLAGIGVALLRSPLPEWVGWLLIGSMVLVLIATAIFRDIPPGVYYLPTLVTGVMLYRYAF
jgi:hypothetical protein